MNIPKPTPAVIKNLHPNTKVFLKEIEAYIDKTVQKKKIQSEENARSIEKELQELMQAKKEMSANTKKGSVQKIIDREVKRLKVDLRDVRKSTTPTQNDLTVLWQDSLDNLKDRIETGPLNILQGKTLNNFKKNIIKDLDKLLAYKANPAVLNEFSKISKNLDAFYKKYKNPQWNLGGLEEINDLVIFISALKYLSGELHLAKKAVAESQIIQSNSHFPDHKKREQCASDCFESARSQLSSAIDFDDIGMLAMFVSDARKHYKLGIALLEGRYDDIDKSGDIASRDGLSDRVWGYIYGEICEKKQEYKRVEKIIKSHQKIKEGLSACDKTPKKSLKM